MTLRGDLSTMPAADLLDWIDRRELAGELRATRGGVERRLLIAGRCITLASCNQPTEYLGQLLIIAGHIDEEQLRRAQAAQEGNALALGKSLLVANQVSEADLRTALILKVRECLCDLLSWSDGTFIYEPGVRGAKVDLAIAVPLRDAMVEGAPRAEEWRAARALIPGDDAGFFIADWRAFQAIDARSPEGLLLQDVARAASVREIIMTRHALPFDIYRALADLVGRQVIKLDRRREKRAVPDARLGPDGLLAAAHGRAQGGDPRGALVLARRAVEKAPGDTGIEAAYRGLERHLLNDLTRALLARYSVPRLGRPLDAEQDANLSPEERWFLGRVDGRWDLMSILGSAPATAIDSLVAVHKLVARGLVTLAG